MSFLGRWRITLRMHLIRWVSRGLCVGILVAVLLGQMPAESAAGRAEDWSDPTNLSNSGSAANPILVKDSAGNLHLAWEDKYAGFMATDQVEGSWSTPAPVRFPWSPVAQTQFSLDAPVPLLVADHSGLIYAFWIDGADNLYFGRVSADGFRNSSMWVSPLKLSDAVLGFAVAVDDQDHIHIVYIRQRETAQGDAGVYYNRILVSGAISSAGYPLYLSPYFQNTEAPEANISIAAGSANDQGIVYVAWDNRPLKRVFLARSVDGGSNWDAAQEIDGPESSAGSSIPYNIAVHAAGNNVAIVWQDGQPGVSCQQFGQVSADSGGTWDGRQALLPGVTGCPSATQFVENRAGQTILVSTVSDQVYMQAWNGQEWSYPKVQATLFSFINPETYATVNLCNRQFVMMDNDQLVVTGSDGESWSDIWVTSRPLSSTAAWFQPESAWSAPTQVTSSAYSIGEVSLAVGDDRDVHALWTQPDRSSPHANSIYYAHWDGASWSTPALVLVPPLGMAYDLSVALGMDGRLYAAWSGGPDGKVSFSWADASRAMNSPEWSAPVLVAPAQSSGSSPEIVLDDSGRVTIAYAVPINEGRGIYLVTSEDEGITWSDPSLVFDGVAAGWSEVGSPHLDVGSDGTLSMVWTQLALAEGGGPLALYFATSKDQGESWSTPARIVESAVVWSDLLMGSDGAVYLAWIEKSRDQYTLQFADSGDGGITWNSPSTITASESSLENAWLLQDPAGQIHIITAANEAASIVALTHWVWSSGDWSPIDTLQIRGDTPIRADDLAVGVSPSGAIFALLSEQVNELFTQETSQYRLLVSSLAGNLPAEFSTLPSPTSAMTEASPALSPTSPPAPSPTVDLAPVSSAPGASGGLFGGSVDGVTAGTVFSTLLVGAGVGFVLFRKKKWIH